MSRKIGFGLSVKEINAAIKELNQYKSDLNHKCQEFCVRLCELGIKTAVVNTGKYGDFITFSIETSDSGSGFKSIMIASNTGLIRSEWRTKDGVKTADISPILMAEFGSGLKANNPKADEFSMGTGTFPGQTHAENPEGWWWMDLDGEWHHSLGYEPTMPVYKASAEMAQNIERIAREVFGS